MSKKFRARCIKSESGYIDPDVVEIYNLDDPLECYPAGKNQFRVGQVLGEEEFYLHSFPYGDEILQIAFRK